MKTLLISYDLMSPETREDYEELIDYIKSFTKWAKPLLSVWLVKTNKSCSKVRDEIKLKTDSNDKILVMNVTGVSWASRGLSKKTTTWMKSNL